MRSALPILLLSGVALADNSMPAATGTFHARCQERFEQARAELIALGEAKVLVLKAPDGRFAPYGRLLLVVGRKGSMLGAEVDEQHLPDRGRVATDTWRSSGDTKLHEERRLVLKSSVLRARISGDENDETAQRFAAVMKRTIDACLAEAQPSEPDPSRARRQQCGDELDATRRRVPALSIGTVERTANSVRLHDPLFEPNTDDGPPPRFYATIECGGAPLPHPRAWELDDAGGHRNTESCVAWYGLHGVPGGQFAAAARALRQTLDRCARDF